MFPLYGVPQIYCKRIFHSNHSNYGVPLQGGRDWWQDDLGLWHLQRPQRWALECPSSALYGRGQMLRPFENDDLDTSICLDAQESMIINVVYHKCYHHNYMGYFMGLLMAMPWFCCIDVITPQFHHQNSWPILQAAPRVVLSESQASELTRRPWPFALGEKTRGDFWGWASNHE